MGAGCRLPVVESQESFNHRQSTAAITASLNMISVRLQGVISRHVDPSLHMIMVQVQGLQCAVVRVQAAL